LFRCDTVTEVCIFLSSAERLTATQHGIVIAYHPEARQIGERILASGGNAADAFIATTIAENVLAEGASSLAGPLGVLIYRVPKPEDLHSDCPDIEYLDADFNTPLSPKHREGVGWRRRGRAVLIPGAPAGLWELAKRYGSKPFPELVEPAIALAEEGFRVPPLMVAMLRWRKGLLRKSEYGRRTFLPGGKPLRIGQTLRQPELAEFLKNFAREGSSYVYQGEWGRRLLEVVQSEGGALTEQDLTEYGVRWYPPWTATYRDRTVYACSGTSYGGLWVLLALKALEHAPELFFQVPYWRDAGRLEIMIRIARQVWSEKFLIDFRALHDRTLVASKLSNEHGATIWKRVREKAPPAPMGIGGSHSYHIIVRDKVGNIVSGTTTIESNPWGDGIFIEGVPLTTAGRLAWNTIPGERRLSPLSMHFVLERGSPCIATGCISDSVVEAGFQLLVDLLDYHLSPVEAAAVPRFGSFALSRLNPLGLRLDRNRLDPRIDGVIVENLKKQKIRVTQKGSAETGLGAILAIPPSGPSEGTTVPLPNIETPFAVPESQK
jgi:gamma-glutamyltranspeptidase/glutathione hydrolase